MAVAKTHGAQHERRTVPVNLRLTPSEVARIDTWRLAARPAPGRGAYIRRRVFGRTGVVPDLAARLRSAIVLLRDLGNTVGRERVEVLAIEERLETLYAEALTAVYPSDLVDNVS